MSEAPFANETREFKALAARVKALERREFWIVGIGAGAFFILLLRSFG